MRSREVFVAAARYAVRSAPFAQQAPGLGFRIAAWAAFGKSLRSQGAAGLPAGHDRPRHRDGPTPPGPARGPEKIMRLSSHLSSSTCSTGMLESRPRQSDLSASHRLFAAEMMRNRNDQRCGHMRHSNVSVSACNRESSRTKGQSNNRRHDTGTFPVPVRFFNRRQSNKCGLPGWRRR